MNFYHDRYNLEADDVLYLYALIEFKLGSHMLQSI